EAAVDSPVESPVAERVGRDGKRRKLPAKFTPLPPVDADHDLIQEMHPDAVTPEQRWRWSLSNAAGDALAMGAFWKREFGDWQRFHSSSELRTLAHQAAAAWQALAQDLARRKT